MERRFPSLRVPLLLLLALTGSGPAAAAPLLQDMQVLPNPVAPGAMLRISAAVVPVGFPLSAVTANVPQVHPGTGSVPLAWNAATQRYEGSVVVTSGVGTRTISVTAADTSGAATTRAANVSVESGKPPVTVANYWFQPEAVRPGGSVAAYVRVLGSFLSPPYSVSLDLTPLGLSPSHPLGRDPDTYDDTSRGGFTVPAGTSPGAYPITATVLEDGSVTQVTALLHVTLGPVVQSVQFDPWEVGLGETATLTVTVSPGDAPVSSVTADLSALSLSSAVPLQTGADGTYTATVTVPADASEIVYRFPVRVEDTQGRATTGTGFVRALRRDPPVLVGPTVGPAVVRPGQSFSVAIGYVFRGCYISSATVDLSAFGLSATALLYSAGGTYAWTYTVPVAASPGRYPLVVTVKDTCGHTLTGTVDLVVTQGPIITAASFSPSTTAPGETTTLSAHVSPGDSPTASVSADLSALGLPASEPLSRDGGTVYFRTLTVPAGTPFGPRTVPVTATDEEGRSITAFATLQVGRTGEPMVILSNTVKPQAARPGEKAVLTLTFEENTCVLAAMTADLSAFGLSGQVPYQGIGMARTVSFTVPEGAPPGDYTITTTVTDACGNVYKPTALLTVLSPVVPGDVDGDGAFTMADAAAALRIAAGLAGATDLQRAAGDVAGNGPDGRAPDGSLTMLDAMALARAWAATH